MLGFKKPSATSTTDSSHPSSANELSAHITEQLTNQQAALASQSQVDSRNGTSPAFPLSGMLTAYKAETTKRNLPPAPTTEALQTDVKLSDKNHGFFVGC